MRFAKNVMGLSGEDEAALAAAGIDALEAYFKSTGIPMTLSELKIGPNGPEVKTNPVVNPVLTSVIVEKVWDDGEYAERPTEVTITLMADGRGHRRNLQGLPIRENAAEKAKDPGNADVFSKWYNTQRPWRLSLQVRGMPINPKTAASPFGEAAAYSVWG